MLAHVTLTEKADGRLDFLNPARNEVYVGVYGDLKIIAHEDFGGDLPSLVPDKWRRTS